MKKYLLTTAAVSLIAGAATAGGLDRTGQPITDIFAEGNVAKLSFGRISPSIGGTGSGIAAIPLPAGTDYDNVGEDYTQVALSIKVDVTDEFSVTLINEQPFGVDLEYPGGAFSTELGGTSAELNSRSTTVIGRYKLDGGFSVHGGVRYQTVEGDIALSGFAYGVPGVTATNANGYSLTTDEEGEWGYLIGAAYERPDIALRVSLTYNSEIDYELDASDTGGFFTSGDYTLETTTPESWNLEFQTGVAEDTLVFGAIRWAAWGDFDVPANGLAGTDLADIDDSTTYTIGVGRRFTEKLVGSVAVSYEDEGDDLVSPLAPTNGLLGVSVGARYDLTEQVSVAGGINYSMVGDAKPQTADTERADFTDNDVFGYGFSISYKF
ncbi:MAG: outer membrane protein transport protein [Pseudomonadota bacterium]